MSHPNQTGAVAAPTPFVEVDAATYARLAAQPTPDSASPPLVERPAAPAGETLADMRAEVATEQARADSAADPDAVAAREYPDGAVPIELVGADGRRGVIHVLAPDDWPSDSNSALHVGDYESWADGCLALDDYERVWCDLRPTLRSVNEMFARFREITGQDAGKSLRSPASLRRARSR